MTGAAVLALTRLNDRCFHLSKNILNGFANALIILSLSWAYFVWGPQRILMQSPLISSLYVLKMGVLVGLYIVALGFYHFASNSTRHSLDKLQRALVEVRFLLPFLLPIFALMLFMDLWELVSGYMPKLKIFSSIPLLWEPLAIMVLFLAVVACLAMFMPPVIIKAWKCQPMENSVLKERLEVLCAKAKFRHAGMLMWTLLNHNFTAAIIGILPRFRYILFTQRLLNGLSAESVEAVLAHEIGHSYRKHLVVIPFIFMGIPVFLSLLSLFFEEGVEAALHIFWPSMQSEGGDIAIGLSLFLGISGIMYAYFRLVFGFYSRLFERQADLHVFVLGLDPHSMIRALEETAEASGIPAVTPNWHHHSIQARIDFLQRCIQHPELVQQHHRRAYVFVGAYFFALSISILLLLAPQLAYIPFFEGVAKAEQYASQEIRSLLTSSRNPINKE